MSIVNTLESIVNELELTDKPQQKVSFIHGLKGWANLEADEKQFPCVVLIEPVISNDTFHQGGLVESEYELFLLFLDRSELEYMPQQHHQIVDSMRALRRQFILRLKEAKNTYNENIFKTINNIKTTDTFNELDVNTSGVGVTLLAKPFNAEGVCV